MSASLNAFALKLRDSSGNIYEPEILHGTTAKTIYACGQEHGTSETESEFMDRFAQSINPYPVNSIYISAVATSPASLFGGSWTQIKDKFLFCAGTQYAAGSIPTGEETVTLTTATMPSHSHSWSVSYYAGADDGVDTYRATTQKRPEDGKITQSSTGGGGAHNNMPPYVVKYIWKRVS